MSNQQKHGQLKIESNPEQRLIINDKDCSEWVNHLEQFVRDSGFNMYEAAAMMLHEVALQAAAQDLADNSMTTIMDFTGLFGQLYRNSVAALSTGGLETFDRSKLN